VPLSATKSQRSSQHKRGVVTTDKTTYRIAGRHPHPRRPFLPVPASRVPCSLQTVVESADGTSSAIRVHSLNSSGQAHVATRRRAMFAAAAGAVIATLAVAVAVVIGEDTFPPREQRKRKRIHVRDRVSISYAFMYFHDAEFTRALRMDRAHFYKLVRTLGIEPERGPVQGARSSGGRIEPDVRLAVTLRLLSGGSAWDLMQLFRLGRSTALCTTCFTQRLIA
jgi:hypothetical protein